MRVGLSVFICLNETLLETDNQAITRGPDFGRGANSVSYKAVRTI